MIFSALSTKVAAWRRYRTTVRELNALSDYDLQDLGIGRSEIESVARAAAIA